VVLYRKEINYRSGLFEQSASKDGAVITHSTQADKVSVTFADDSATLVDLREQWLYFDVR